MPRGAIANAEALGPWAQRRLRLRLRVEGKPPPPPPEKTARSFLGQPVAEPQKWTRVFTLPDAKVTVEHVPGAGHITARRETIGALALIKNIHKGTGLGIAWVLFLDTIAGALITMSLTGFLLWTRLHGSRLLAGGLAIASLGLALAAIVPFLS